MRPFTEVIFCAAMGAFFFKLLLEIVKEFLSDFTAKETRKDQNNKLWRNRGHCKNAQRR